ncbi:hypothetical protein IC582_010128 [Cucumis melo]
MARSFRLREAVMQSVRKSHLIVRNTRRSIRSLKMPESSDSEPCGDGEGLNLRTNEVDTCGD